MKHAFLMTALFIALTVNDGFGQSTNRDSLASGERDQRSGSLLRRGIGVSLTNYAPRFVLASQPHAQKYLVGFSSDGDSGGMVFSELERNITLCVKDKTEKIKPYQAKYATWWLALVDYIGFGLDEFDRGQFDGTMEVAPPWSRIIIVNPSDPSDSFDL